MDHKTDMTVRDGDNIMGAKTVSSVVLTLGLLAGCAAEDSVFEPPTIGEAPEGFAVTIHDANRLTGTFRDANATIRFDAVRGTAGDAALELKIGDKVFAYAGVAVTDAHAGWFRVTAGHQLDAVDIEVSRELLGALTSYLGEDAAAMSLHEASVAKMAYWIAEHSAGEFAEDLAKLEYLEGMPRVRSLNNDGVTCIRRNTNVTAYYDDRNNAVSSQSVYVGSDWGTSNCGSGTYSCMGRCGAGCSGFGGGWTLDCLEHDVCSHNLCASGGSSSPDCGDEYNHASGDIFSSCGG